MKGRKKKSLEYQSPQASNYSNYARRSTRVSRVGASTTAESTTTNTTTTKRNISFNTDEPARCWTQVLRPPGPASVARWGDINFKVLKWVPVENLTEEERLVYDQQEKEKENKRTTNSNQVNVKLETKIDDHDREAVQSSSNDLQISTLNQEPLPTPTTDHLIKDNNHDNENENDCEAVQSSSSNLQISTLDQDPLPTPSTDPIIKEDKSIHNDDGNKSDIDDNDIDNQCSRKKTKLDTTFFENEIDSLRDKHDDHEILPESSS